MFVVVALFLHFKRSTTYIHLQIFVNFVLKLNINNQTNSISYYFSAKSFTAVQTPPQKTASDRARLPFSDTGIKLNGYFGWFYQHGFLGANADIFQTEACNCWYYMQIHNTLILQIIMCHLIIVLVEKSFQKAFGLLVTVFITNTFFKQPGKM